ncbi:MAG: tetratricopeptide repeat protein, partial [Polyangiaceae bacterium]
PELGITGRFERTVNDVLADLAAGDAAPWCQDRIACAEPAQAAIGFLAARQPGLCGPSITRARLDVALDDAPTALHNLQIAAQTSTDAFECWRSLGELALASKSDAYISIAEQATSASGCAADDECANHLIWLASLEERRGNYGRALGFYERAQEKAPTRQDIIERTAQLASSLKLHGQALEAYRKLSRLGPNAGKWQQLADHEKDLLLHQAGP